MESSASVKAGAVLGNYKLTRALGRGGMGVVFEALDLRDNQPAAVKILHGNARDAMVAQAFVRFAMEVQAVKRINHPNVVRLLDTGHHTSGDGTQLAYYAMEKVEGLTLAELVARLGTVPVAAACVIIRQAALALQAAHAQGIIHRDVKPENLMLAQDGRVVVLDFGICKFADIHNVTSAGQVMGTSRYLTPEHLCGLPTDARSDVFALGAVLFFLCTGSHLRESAAVADLMTLMSTGADLKRVQQADLPPEARRVLNNALAQDAVHRYPSAQALADALQQAVEKLSTLDAAGHIGLLLDSLKEVPAAPPSDEETWSEPTDRHALPAAPAHKMAATLEALQDWRRRLQPGLQAAVDNGQALRLVAVGIAAVLLLGLATWGMRKPPAPRPSARATPSTPSTPAPRVAPSRPAQATPIAPSWEPRQETPVAQPAAPVVPAAAPAPTAAFIPEPVAPPPQAAPEQPAPAEARLVDAPLFANDRNVDNQPLRVNEASQETDAQRRIRECAERATAMGSPLGTCPATP
jgi:serine/threonine-protein kinase